jgi:hypothetical protein
MTADTKKLHILFGDWVALSAHMIRSGLLIAGRRLSASNQWTRGLIVEHRWKAILEKQVINMRTREKEEVSPGKWRIRWKRLSCWMTNTGW